MNPISIEQAKELVNFEPLQRNRSANVSGFGEDQLRGAVMAHNMIAINRCAYIADEVGLGKTYVALGVAGFLRHFDPPARILFLTPRENIQQKWIKELKNFVRVNWRVIDNRVKSLQGTPAREALACGSLPEFAHALTLNNDRDYFLRMTSFSVTSKEAEDRRKHRRRIQSHISWVPSRFLSTKNPIQFVEGYGQLLNAIVPEIDLLIVDEAHNLKHGMKGSNISTRNRMLATVFGRPLESAPDWYGPRIKNILFLSATPFEGDYAELYNQLDLFGFGGATLKDSNGQNGIPVRRIGDPSVEAAEKKKIVGRFMMRRISDLKLGETRFTKNLYRREWRNGGYGTHDQPMEIADPKQRLTVALVQKKVTEILQDDRFNNSFQIGMLSSFESFLESMKRKRRKLEEQEPTFDGDQDATQEERKGIDTDVLEDLILSYREEFKRPLPHPKMDVTADTLKHSFQTGEKALVFVRRVATSKELAAKISVDFDDWIREKMLSELPDLREEIGGFFDEYERSKLEEGGEIPNEEEDEIEEDEITGIDFVDEEMDSNSFFSWFFRGKRSQGQLTGAAFQRNRLSNQGSRYSILFEDDYISWLLGYPEDALKALSDAVGAARSLFEGRLRRLAFGAFKERRRNTKSGYPVLYTLEAYQAAALHLLEVAGGEIGEKAKIILSEKYSDMGMNEEDCPAGFPHPKDFIGLKTFFPLLMEYPDLRADLLPEEEGHDFREIFRRREQRRELLGTLSRLGASYIDLYILAIRQIGSMTLRGQAEGERPESNLAQEFIHLLLKQKESKPFSAYYELSEAARTFDLLMAVNFPDVPNAPLSDLATIYGRVLQKQVPVASMAGAVNKRVVQQFRMPGFPLVLVTTDVLQEGEDLHTFCMRVFHYGITWTPSAMEQRTGRVDRIGSLFHRGVHGVGDDLEGDDLIQVFYPHLQDTIEVLQIRRVLERLNRFQRMIHDVGKETPEYESHLDASREFLARALDIAPIQETLVSAFPIREDWLRNGRAPDKVQSVDVEEMQTHFRWLCDDLIGRMEIEERRIGLPHRFSGVLQISTDQCLRLQPIELELIAHPTSHATLLRCKSPIGRIDLRDDQCVDLLYEIQKELNQVKICSSYDLKSREFPLQVVGDILFHPDSTQVDEVHSLIQRVVHSADEIEELVLNEDQDPETLVMEEEETTNG